MGKLACIIYIVSGVSYPGLGSSIYALSLPLGCMKEEKISQTTARSPLPPLVSAFYIRRKSQWLVQVTHIVSLWKEYWRFGPGVSSDRVLGWEWIKGKDWRASDTLRCKETDTCCSTTFLITDYSIIHKALGPSRLAHTLGSIATTAGYSDRHEGRWEGQNSGLVQ